jgi:hypothetical protein
MKNMKRVWYAKVDGVRERFTRKDVERYVSRNQGMGGCRSFGPVSGDWRMIDSLVDAAISYFDM